MTLPQLVYHGNSKRGSRRGSSPERQQARQKGVRGHMAKKLMRGGIDSRFERKRKPIPPKSICKNALCRFFGIVSPTLISVRSDAEVEEYEICVLKYLCYKRQLRRYQWKKLYRIVRSNESVQQIFENWFKNFEKGLMDEYDSGKYQEKEISKAI